MTVSTMRRLAALVGIGGGVIVAGCKVSPAGVGAMTPVQIDSAVAVVAWTGCDTVARIAVGGGTTNVEICAAPNAHTYGPNKVPAGPGAPVARMRNLGTRVEARWGLQPNGTYPIWLYQGTGGASYAIIGNGVNTTGKYFGCKHKPAAVSRASFGTCADNPAAMSARMDGSNLSSASGPSAGEKDSHAPANPMDGPAWISCTDGCCTTDAL